VLEGNQIQTRQILLHGYQFLEFRLYR